VHLAVWQTGTAARAAEQGAAKQRRGSHRARGVRVRRHAWLLLVLNRCASSAFFCLAAIFHSSNRAK
jgi:hypothetical protein